MTRCTATIRVPTQDSPVQCDREHGHDETPGDAMHNGHDNGSGRVQRRWITGTAGDNHT